MRCQRSPLILAVIFITFFHSVLSRHRIRHHKDRFKRQQGAHLYLPGSYVTSGGSPGEPEGGPWGEWSAPSPCSRTCGGGVASQWRTCQEGYDCSGPTARHFTCNTQDCPDNADYRAQQCSEFDNIQFEGVYYEWVPYTKGPNPCDLNCMPRGDKFYYNHGKSVVDGTRCNDEKNDVCVNGTCQPVGCDMMLGSNIAEDECRVCGGNGSTCNTFESEVPMKDMVAGYNDILLIPAGATNIRVEEAEPSNNYLAVRNTSGHYYLNGNFRIDFPRTVEFSGCKFKYERYPQEFAAPDIITCLGPTDEPLFIVLLYQESGAPVKYKYSLPNNIPAPPNSTYAWTFDEFTECSASCGGGYQFRNVTCNERNTLVPADTALCDASNEPEAQRRCNLVPCPAQWVPLPWKPCSVPCGEEGGTQKRDITCQKMGADGIPTEADIVECKKNSPKPEIERKCNVGKVCAKWHTGPWKPCDHLCGEGQQTRKVQCYIQKNRKVVILEDSECEGIEPKPEEKKKCFVRPCEGVDWITSEWSGCERICGLKQETRRVMCATANGKIYPDDLCDAESMPESVRDCETTNATCEYLWYASQWSECSVTCGKGIQTRTLFCGVVTEEGVKKVENEKCDQSKHFETSQNCTGEQEECEGEWFSGPWGKCSKPCGGGTRSKKVVCIKDMEVMDDPSVCGSNKIVFSEDKCNEDPCSEDTIMSTDVTHSVDESEPTDKEGTDQGRSTPAGESTKETESVGTKDTDSTKVSAITEIFEITTAKTKEQPKKGKKTDKAEDEDDYEIVPDTNCDDGEWVDYEPPLGAEQKEEPVGTTKIPDDLTSLDDMMLSDGTTLDLGETTIDFSADTGSGDGGLTSESDLKGSTSEDTFGTDEGSGTEPTIISESTYSEGSSSTSDKVSASASEETATESSGGTTVAGTSDASGSTETGGTTEAGSSTDSSQSTDINASGSTESGSSADAESSTASAGTDVSGTTQVSGNTDGASSFTSESSTDSSSQTADSDSTTESSDSSTTVDLISPKPLESGSSGTKPFSKEMCLLPKESGCSEQFKRYYFDEPSGECKEFIYGGCYGNGNNFETIEECMEKCMDATTISSETSPGSETTDISGSTVESSSSISSESSTDNSASTETATEFSSSSIITTESSDSTADASGSTEFSSSTIDSSASTVVSTDISGSTESESSGSTIEFTGSTDMTSSSLSVSGSTDTADSSGSTTEFTGATESTIEFTGSTVDKSTSDSTDITPGITDISGSTIEFTGSTTEFTGSTTEFTGSTTEPTGSTIEFTGSTESASESTGSTEVSSSSESASGATTEITGSPESTTEFTGSTESTVEFTGSTEISTSTETFTGSTTEYSGSTSSTEEFTATTESVTGLTTTSDMVTGSTETDIFGSTTTVETTDSSTGTDLYSTTPILELFIKKKTRMCKRMKVMKCKKTKWGCCWDKITPAEGPFDMGCPSPKTCKEAKYGCCEDGVSAALGPKGVGCPRSMCNETLFGCCWDNKTVSEGNDGEGCPPECLGSDFGCCDDNITEAKGPDHKGCQEEIIETTTVEMSETTGTTETATDSSTPETTEPTVDCNNTTYRCCPDGTTTATGPGFQGCGLPCSESPHGCCSDGKMPAHGPSGEGCCLTSTFGCCPDNLVPARGPNGHGCDCHMAPYGCCPDNKTSATGYYNEGCGCQYKDHGCCPDGVTAAGGPNFEGCPCQSFQFGCCPDGVSIAQGPHNQGCGCQYKEFGCCSDEKTPATGPNGQGCGCESSKYGCCLDGRNEAKGDAFQGCEEIPPNKQAACGLTKDNGQCHNYTVKWHYDMSYGGCSRFWYGSCGGNDNRFKTKDECEGICVEPQGRDRCNLPKVPGPCQGYYPQWYYDASIKQCAQFIYGGCLGNNNRFETREECMSLCQSDNQLDPCEQKMETGPCRGNYLRFYYDKDAKQCAPFTYGGCQGNNNNFLSMESCQQKCKTPGQKKEHCTLPREKGNCTQDLPNWYYDVQKKVCSPFYFTGCNGNQNNFQSKEQCEADCPKEVAKHTCQLPAEVGECGNYVDRWYYDTREKSCRQFYYGGCGGNENNFETQHRCEQTCQKQEQPPRTEAPITNVETSPPEPFTREMCFLPSETGPCRANIQKYFYDRSDGVCKEFVFGGCMGNGNNFDSIEQCLQHCGGAQDRCSLPPVVGPCNGQYLQYYYDAATDSCQPFNFGGCGGNYNRFQDQATCEQGCKKSQSQTIGTQSPPVPSDIAMCYLPMDHGSCNDSIEYFFYDQNTGSCTPFVYTGCGGNDNKFTSEEQCERQCGRFRGQDVCNMEHTPGPCRGYFIKYYFDRLTGRCEQFGYGGCQGNGNRFSSNKECEDICLTRGEVKLPNATTACLLPVDQGSCTDSSYKRWYFNDEYGECKPFIYSGCGGNFNNFRSYQACLDYCGYLLPKTEPPAPEPQTDMAPHPCQAVFDECANLRCSYGVEPYVDENECNRCRCKDPCYQIECPPGEQCAIDLNRNKTVQEPADYIAVCRLQNKPGSCPTLEQDNTNCEQECSSDAHCALDLKCCSTGCGTACVDPTSPAQLFTQQPEPLLTDSPMEAVYQPPKVDAVVFKPEVNAEYGDQAILNCAVTGNPNPKVTWRKGNILIDGTQERYRIRLDQSLQIVTLYKTDSGIYLCTAENGLGDPITNQIMLNVVDGPERPATVLDPIRSGLPPPTLVSLNAPAAIDCFALGNPHPSVYWWKDTAMIPFHNNEFEVRRDYSLLIHSVKLSNLGIYTCQAYNGVGKAASWSVTVKAKGPYRFRNSAEERKYGQFIVNPEGQEPVPPQIQTTAPPEPTRVYTRLATRPARTEPPYRQPPERPTPQPHEQPLVPDELDNNIYPEPDLASPNPFFEPVRVNITTTDQRYPLGSDIELPCSVVGWPKPQVEWYKDGVPIEVSDRIDISDSHTLSILKATKADSGIYECEAKNSFSRGSSSLSIAIEGVYIHPKCKDNPFFANCKLIVKAKACSHRYYAKFCCRSCTESGQLPADGSHLQQFKRDDHIESNFL